MSYSTDDRTFDEPSHLQPQPVTGRRFAGVARHFGKRTLLFTGGILLLAASAWYAANWWVTGRFVETTDDAYVGGDVTPIAPHVSGYIQSILVHDNQYVRAGQPLVRLDPDDYLAALDHARAAISERKAAVAALNAEYELQHAAIRQAEANLAARQAEATFAAEEATRYRTLANNDAGSRQDAQRALASARKGAAAVTAATAAVVVSKQRLSVLKTRIIGAKAAIRAAEADLRIARLRLGYTTIDSPIDGYVGDRSAQVGAYVPAGTNLLSVVPARGLWVDANFKEDDLHRMKPGDPATIVADVSPGRVLHGHVASLAPATGAVFSVIPPQNATGNFTKIVQRVPVRIVLDGETSTLGLLRPGLSATVSVNTKRQPGDRHS